MFIVTHAAIGGLLGQTLPTHPVLVGAFSFGVHFVTDAIPHGDTNLYKGYVAGTKMKKAIIILAVDAVAAAVFFAYLLWRVPDEHRLPVIVGVLAGVLPDILVAISELLHVDALRWFHRLHFHFHNIINRRTGDLSLRAGMIMETVILGVLLFFTL